MSLENGDTVVVAGPKKNDGSIEAYAIRNLNTNFLISDRGSKASSFGIGMAVVGFATMAALVGFIFLYFAYINLKRASEIKAAVKLVMDHPQPSALK